MTYLYSADDAIPQHLGWLHQAAQARPGLHNRHATSSVPSLIKREDLPPAYTMYVNILLGGEAPARAMTGIFVPPRYKPQPQVDLVVYLHGYKNSYSPTTSIDGYWNTRHLPHFPLREGLNSSGKNLLLVAPTLGPRSQAGRLTHPGGFDRYLGQVMTALKQYGPY
jgi:hypothetical protein